VDAMRTLSPTHILAICLSLNAGYLIASGHQPEYGVSLKVAKAAALAKAKTYSWTSTYPSVNKAVDAQIKAAVDRELSARGFTKLDAEPSDVLVTYSSLRSTDVDLKGKKKDGILPMYPVGTLVVELRAPASREPLFRVRIDTPINTTPAELEADINAAVKAMFAKYPAPKISAR
jgi:hypothetical protein